VRQIYRQKFLIEAKKVEGKIVLVEKEKDVSGFELSSNNYLLMEAILIFRNRSSKYKNEI
jgi:hypothetical protein